MKKKLIFAIAAIALVACNNEPGVDKTTNPNGTVTFRGVAANSETRMEVADPGTGLTFAWKGAEDKIGLYATCEGDLLKHNAMYKATSVGAESDFTPESVEHAITWGDGAHCFYAYHPHNAAADENLNAVPICLPAEQTQNGINDLAHIAAYNFIYAKNEGVSSGDGVVELAFGHVFSVLKVAIAADEGTAKVKAVKFRSTNTSEAVAFDCGTFDFDGCEYTIDEGENVSNEITLAFAEPVTVGTTPVYAYLLISPGHGGEEFEVAAVVEVEGVDEEQGANKFKAPAVGIPGGVKAPASVTVEGVVGEPEPDNAIDLSAIGTANTYYALQADTEYKFRATVKGNGYTGTYSWTTEEEAISQNFGDVSIDPKSALVLWYNCPFDHTYYQTWKQLSPISMASVELKNGYIYFKTSKNLADKGDDDPAIETFTKGNVVIAAFAEEGLTYDNIEATNGIANNATILWSWNIVITDDFNDPANQLTVGEYTIMDRSLGAVISPKAAARTYNIDHYKNIAAIGNLYQWGRKDPFPGPTETMGSPGTWLKVWSTPVYTPITNLQNFYEGSYKCMVNEWIYNQGNNKSNSIALTTELGAGFDLADAVDYAANIPYRLMYTGNGGTGADNTAHWAVDIASWKGSDATKKHGWRALWGNPSPDVSGAKSIHDPCPVGWKVATPELIELLRTSATEIGKLPATGEFKFVTLTADGSDHYFSVSEGRGMDGWFGNSRINETKVGQCLAGLFTSGFASSGATNRAYVPMLELNLEKEGITVPFALGMGDTYGATAQAVRCMKE